MDINISIIDKIKDINTTALTQKETIQDLVLSFFSGVIYDAFKLALAFILIKFFYEKLYMNYKWGNWQIKVVDSKNKNFEGTIRNLSPEKANQILKDLDEFSIYVKGIVASTNTWLNVDIATNKAKDIGLVKIDKKAKDIIIDIAKNIKKDIPKKDNKKIEFTQKTQKQIDNIEKLLTNLVNKK